MIISILAGLLSVLSLLVSLSLPHWVITVETSPSSSSPSSSSPSSPSLHLHIGLFSVCPEWGPEGNLSQPVVPLVTCLSLSSSEEGEDTRTSLAPLGSRTTRVLGRIRSVSNLPTLRFFKKGSSNFSE